MTRFRRVVFTIDVASIWSATGFYDIMAAAALQGAFKSLPRLRLEDLVCLQSLRDWDATVHRIC